MIDILQIAEPVKVEFEQFKEEFYRQISSETPLLQSAIRQVTQTNGKHIRPLLLLLCAKACGVPDSQTQQYALTIEMLHTATLIHDDVVDDTKERRNSPSLNAIYDNRIAVLTGDYILACAMSKVAETGNINIINLIAQVCRCLSEGEMLQLNNSEQLTTDETAYFEMIEQKTASLISASAEIGAVSVCALPEMIHLCRQFGMLLGVCFQIKDDIFDYYEDASIGKPTCNDLREGKITLPLLYALNNSTPEENDLMFQIIKYKDFNIHNLYCLTEFAKKKGGIDYAEKKLLEYKQKALQKINMLPPSPSRDSLVLMAEYFAERNY